MLDENGTAVSTDRRCAASALVPSFATLNECFSPSPGRGAQDDDSDDDEEEEEEDEDEDEEDEEGDGDDPSSVAGGPELTRTERREIKKKQAAEKEKAGEGGGGDEDDLTANPNHVTKKLNISDLSAPRELTRRERYVPVSRAPVPFLFFVRSHYTLFFISCCVGSRRRRRMPRNVIGR